MMYSLKITQVCFVCAFHRAPGVLLYPFVRAPHPRIQRFWLRELGFPRIRLPAALARVHVIAHLRSVFSHILRSSAALISLKRKYSHETEGGENEEVGSQPESDAVSPSSPTVSLLFHPSISRPAGHPLVILHPTPTLPKTVLFVYFDWIDVLTVFPV
jgi:hypothetical protein